MDQRPDVRDQLPDAGIDATQYANANCTGTSNTFSVLITSAVLDYQVGGTTRRA